jgi:hypothetical protein
METLQTPEDVVADVLARIVAAIEALEDGAADYASTILRDLELDLQAYKECRPTS